MIAGITASVRRLQGGGGGDLPGDIGQAFGGGFYAGDIQYPDGQWYKLIVADASADITGANSRWRVSNGRTDGTYSLTDGVTNTEAMVADGVPQHPAAQHCVSFDGGGNSDWYMPAKDELNVIYLNLGFNRPDCPADFLGGGSQAFFGGNYWTSTHASNFGAWFQRFSDGEPGNTQRDVTTNRVRPVRRIAFTP